MTDELNELKAIIHNQVYGNKLKPLIEVLDDLAQDILKWHEEKTGILKDRIVLLNEEMNLDIQCQKNIALESKLNIAVTGLEAIKKHVELYLKGDLKLSTTWRIASESLQKIEGEK